MAPDAPDALWRLAASELVAGFRAGSFTPVDALDACLARAEACEPALNAMVCFDRAGACRAAEASRARWAAGRPLGPLDGVPMTAKDNLHVTGLPTAWGSRLLRGVVPAADELPVRRLREAGAVLFGKTNLPEFAMQGVTTNALSGTTRNPWDLALTPGGSSGGAAAAVAAGYGPLALATDGGGSIRRPASHCGLVGFKPSMGTVPRGGGLPDIFLDYEVAGGIGRNVQDVRAMTGVLADTPMVVPPPRGARILFVPRFGSHPVDAGIAAQVREAAKRFEALGHRVDEAASFELAERVNALWPLLSAAGLAWMFGDAATWPALGVREGSAPDERLCGDAARAALAQGLAAGAASLFDVLAAVQRMRQALDVLFATHAFILTPATAALPWPAQQTHPATIDGQPVGPRGHAVFTAFANAAGLPAIAMPCGDVGGLPTGFQLVGRARADAALLALALQFEQVHPRAAEWPDGRTRPDGQRGPQGRSESADAAPLQD